MPGATRATSASTSRSAGESPTMRLPGDRAGVVERQYRFSSSSRSRARSSSCQSVTLPSRIPSWAERTSSSASSAGPTAGAPCRFSRHAHPERPSAENGTTRSVPADGSPGRRRRGERRDRGRRAVAQERDHRVAPRRRCRRAPRAGAGGSPASTRAQRSAPSARQSRAAISPQVPSRRRRERAEPSELDQDRGEPCGIRAAAGAPVESGPSAAALAQLRPEPGRVPARPPPRASAAASASARASSYSAPASRSSAIDSVEELAHPARGRSSPPGARASRRAR